MISSHEYRLYIALVGIVLFLGMAVESAGAQAAPPNEFIDALRAAKATCGAGQWTQAARAWERVVQMNPVNEEYWQRLAEAQYKSGEFKQAIPAFEKVLDLGGYCFPSETAYSIARSYAALGDKENAAMWLQDAFARGYRDLDHAQSDPSFKLLHDDPRFVELVGPFEDGQLSRDQGWRRDLALLQRELERKSYPQFVKMSHEELEAEVTNLSKNIPKLSDLQAALEVMKLMAIRRRCLHTPWSLPKPCR